MNKNKKGFTLVEMLAAIGILLLITILTYPSFNKLNKKTEEKFDYSIKTIVEHAAKIYVDNNKELIDAGIDYFAPILGTSGNFAHGIVDKISKGPSMRELKLFQKPQAIKNNENSFYLYKGLIIPPLSS